MTLRSALGRRLDWLDTRVEAGFSNFLFIDKQYRSHPVLRRIFSLARLLSYKSLLIEDLTDNTCELLTDENRALSLRSSDYRNSTTHRLSFWRCLPDQVTAPEDFIGYAIFKSDRFDARLAPQDHVFEAVLPPVRLEAQNNFIHCRRTYTVQTAAGPQSVSGVLYAQQNDLTFVCAHVAMRTALACLLPSADISYATMNELAGVDHQKRRVGEGAGLSPEDLETILSGVGIAHTKIVHEPSQGLELPTEFQRDLYGFIESGTSGLIGFELEDPHSGPNGPPRHIVPIIGHTFNDDAWVPDAQRAYFKNELQYFSSESWLSSYLLHDDNFGPYFCLPRHFLRKGNFRILFGLQRQRTEFSASEAEAVGFDFLQAIAHSTPRVGQDWYDRFSVYARNGLLVLRSLLIERASYLRHLQQITNRDGTHFEPELISCLEDQLPERFWMVEASAQELFTASRRKFGEVLLSSTTPLPRPLNSSLMLAARLPGILMRSNAIGLSTTDSNLRGHTSIYTGLSAS